jgi:hypothetical protein
MTRPHPAGGTCRSTKRVAKELIKWSIPINARYCAHGWVYFRSAEALLPSSSPCASLKKPARRTIECTARGTGQQLTALILVLLLQDAHDFQPLLPGHRSIDLEPNPSFADILHAQRRVVRASGPRGSSW